MRRGFWSEAGSQPFLFATRRLGVPLTQDALVVSVPRQRMVHLQRTRCARPNHDGSRFPNYVPLAEYTISTSRFGIGQKSGSNCTPLGLHRIAERIGGGWPVGTVFKARQPIGFTWKGHPDAKITNRIFWLEGLESGFNRGGTVDSHQRYIYIHGTGDEPSLGRPASCGCIHMATNDLIPLFDRLPIHSLVWME